MTSIKMVSGALLALTLCFFLGTQMSSRALGQDMPGARYDLVSLNMGPFLYRLDKMNGDVCAIKAFEMDFAYRSKVRICGTK